jgi:hypothetical protein
MQVIIADYNDQRLNHLAGMLQSRFPGCTVTQLKTHTLDEINSTDFNLLTQLHGLAKAHSLLIGHLGGNPSGYDCLKAFKAVNPKGKVVLYTKSESIPLSQLSGLKLADRVFQRSQDDTQVFKDADEMMNIIHDVTSGPGVGYLRSRFKDPVFITLCTATVGLLAAVVTLITNLLKGK